MFKSKAFLSLTVMFLVSSAQAADVSSLARALLKVAKGADSKELSVFAQSSGQHIGQLGATETIRTNLLRLVPVGKNSKGTHLLVDAWPASSVRQEPEGVVTFTLARVENKYSKMTEEDLYYYTYRTVDLESARMPFHIEDELSDQFSKAIKSVEEELGLDISSRVRPTEIRGLSSVIEGQAIILKSFDVDARALDVKVIREIMDRFSQM